jgi:hypothetical protein
MGKQISGGRERLAHLAEAGQARYAAARAKGGAPRKDGLKFVRDAERRMRKSREANLPAGPDGFVGAAAASGKYGPGETAASRSIHSYASQGCPRQSRRICPARGAAHAAPRKNRRVLGESIEKRPAEAAGCGRLGDWERDLVEGARAGDSCALPAMAERKARHCMATGCAACMRYS